ncbi:STAS domain-containing protein [Isoptericola sp. NPDC056605]|uniref:STAS domain-containing protein n=1 Tax=Isoptericola sp. NPDC056605 TaxID=3345876 RepID=UPI00368421F6
MVGSPPGGSRGAPHATIEAAVRGRVVMVRMAGEVDAACVAEAVPTIAMLDTLAGCRPVLVDTHDVTFMDSSGVALLERVVRLCRAAGVPVALLDPAVVVTEVLGLLGLDRWFPVVRSADRASA